MLTLTASTAKFILTCLDIEYYTVIFVTYTRAFLIFYRINVNFRQAHNIIHLISVFILKNKYCICDKFSNKVIKI
ncbi:MAG: hypothetical protein BHV81_03350 [Butyricimonas synergistica]|nr:MAG: hypothetical protein BHV81_03350 [Butyricimonas synergistica]